jgi:MFS family permease
VTIFEREYSHDVAIQLSLLLCVFILVATILSIFLIERVGRKKLLAASMIGMAAASLALGSGPEGLQIVICFLVFVFSFGLGLGSIPWLIIGELIPEAALSHVSSISTALNWIVCFLFALVAPMGITNCKWVGFNGSGIWYILHLCVNSCLQYWLCCCRGSRDQGAECGRGCWELYGG